MVEVKAITNIRSLLGGLARTMNLVNPNTENHHERTAYFAYFIARQIRTRLRWIWTDKGRKLFLWNSQ